jgi:hypothetical protein
VAPLRRIARDVSSAELVPLAAAAPAARAPRPAADGPSAAWRCSTARSLVTPTQMPEDPVYCTCTPGAPAAARVTAMDAPTDL